MKLPFFICLLVIAALFFLSFAPMALAREKTPEIRHIVVTSGEGSLLLSASIHGAFSERLFDELAHGSELTFIFIVELVRQRSGSLFIQVFSSPPRGCPVFQCFALG